MSNFNIPNLGNPTAISWRRVVLRKDSPIRMFNVAMQHSSQELNDVNSPHLRTAKFDRMLIDNFGAVHVDTDQMTGFLGALIKTSVENPGYFQRIGEKYIKLGHALLDWLRELNSQDLQQFSPERLRVTFDEFCKRYIAYTPILWVPFAVERRYVTEYPHVLQKIADRIDDLTRRSSEQTSSVSALLAELVPEHQTRAQLLNSIKGVIEHSDRRTMAEGKDLSLVQIASLIRRNPMLLSLFRDGTPSFEEIGSVDPRTARKLFDSLEAYRWIAQWGYPPFYSESTIEDFIAEVAQKLSIDDFSDYDLVLKQEDDKKKSLDLLLKIGGLSDHDKELIHDLNFYTFLRTYRMEVKIKAQYLSVKLLREIERSGLERGTLRKDDIFFMIPPEISHFAETGKVPSDLKDRRDGWVLIVSGDDYLFLTGRNRQEFYKPFLSVVDLKATARSVHNLTAEFVGGKGNNLFKLIQLNYKVPKFFVVTTHAFKGFIDSNGLSDWLPQMMERFRDTRYDVESISKKITTTILNGSIDGSIRETILEMKRQLGLSQVAVRSSATVEDSENLSWAGRFESCLYVSDDDLEISIKRVWASLYSPIAIQYAIENRVDLTKMVMAVVVQEMIEPEVSGTINTTLSADRTDLMEIEAAYGQGEPIVKGEVTPDRYVVSKNGLTVVDVFVSRQTRANANSGWIEIGEPDQQKRKLSEQLLRSVAELARKIESDFEQPQDIEYCAVGDSIWVLQTRPETGFDTHREAAGENSQINGELLLVGQRGRVETTVRGVARVLGSVSDGNRLKPGEILVANAATPAWDMIILRSAAIVTNEGGSTCHAIRVANERRFPAVVGVGNATELIKDGEEIVVDTRDPFKGKVYRIKNAEI